MRTLMSVIAVRIRFPHTIVAVILTCAQIHGLDSDITRRTEVLLALRTVWVTMIPKLKLKYHDSAKTVRSDHPSGSTSPLFGKWAKPQLGKCRKGGKTIGEGG